ncbi:YihY/virulence factor BrkB family protein [Cytophaga hutchinsonii]|uniref:Probable ribonuclease n=1 Tax=Cytophaga hutchinsonii (strain ATCC 33406 / DSM 1761 / CIP 103989 / NBRC 15051 / NCIMB 9469 / D465) TaxID=269798 RepID=A0A6N4SWU9_CYTH3|nr:YihY/virulence factor BrkB family protein [Cytophaga hutchinsonii]ABG60781.1 probable ribonuclease [Cytophaga hutchinsonii ATCC 33406]SFX71809.1 membrane protein [Cytophaga hutchinsonii ATCC 33406]
MLIYLKDFPGLLKTTFKEWNKRDPFRQSAVIAYYAIFSMPGLLVLIVTIMGYFFSRDVVSQNIIHQIASTFGAEVAKQTELMLLNAGKTKETILGSIIGVATLLVGATGVFVALQKTLNEIWEVEITNKKGILPMLKNRLFSFGLILAIAFLLLISLVVSTALSAVGEWIQSDMSEIFIAFFNIINFTVSLIIISFLFALIFRILPDVHITWKQVWLGAILTGILFTIGKTAIGFYFGKATPESAYGAGGSIVLLLLWVSYSSMILFFGAEFTHTFTKKYFPVKTDQLSKEEKEEVLKV